MELDLNNLPPEQIEAINVGLDSLAKGIQIDPDFWKWKEIMTNEELAVAFGISPDLLKAEIPFASTSVMYENSFLQKLKVLQEEMKDDWLMRLTSWSRSRATKNFQRSAKARKRKARRQVTYFRHRPWIWCGTSTGRISSSQPVMWDIDKEGKPRRLANG